MVIGVLVGGIVFGSIGVVAATYFSAKDISFTPTNAEWTATNVEEAVNDLYEISNKTGGTIDNPVIYIPAIGSTYIVGDDVAAYYPFKIRVEGLTTITFSYGAYAYGGAWRILDNNGNILFSKQTSSLTSGSQGTSTATVDISGNEYITIQVLTRTNCNMTEVKIY